MYSVFFFFFLQIKVVQSDNGIPPFFVHKQGGGSI